MLKVQAKLQSDNSFLTAWIDPKVKVGNKITLKNSDEPTRLWTVLSFGEPRELSEINSTWKVGGLN